MFKHLHGRGEDKARIFFKTPSMETPPRTWRRRVCNCLCGSSSRNTSTDVEKTYRVERVNVVRRKHLHGRGEDPATTVASAPSRETPPRTWRRHPLSFCSSFAGGNTSTDVEKTCAECSRHKRLRKHLHGRGEDCLYGEGNTRSVETPPRTWRRQQLVDFVVTIRRNTSTDVEKTQKARIKLRYGEETPPRTWRRPYEAFRRVVVLRNTSTDVEKTAARSASSCRGQKHLHGRGED